MNIDIFNELYIIMLHIVINYCLLFLHIRIIDLTKK